MDTKTLEKLQRIYDQADNFGKSLMEKEFPELKESDDEKNVKNLINELKDSLRAANCQNDATGGGHEKRIALLEWGIAWIEKQGEKDYNELPNGEDYGIDSLYHALQILQATLGEVDGYQSDDGILEHECAISAVEKLYTQIVWTEEDEHAMKQIIACLRGQINSDLPAMTNWIKSIKQRLTILTEESE